MLLYCMIIFLKRLLIANYEIINEFIFKKPGPILLKNASHSADGVTTVNYTEFLDEQSLHLHTLKIQKNHLSLKLSPNMPKLNGEHI